VKQSGFRIGELGRRTGVSRKALRLYEARGILPPPARTAGGYRLYGQEAIALVRFVNQARRLGLTLGEIRQLVDVRRAGHPACPHVRTLLEEKARDLAALLRAIHAVLRDWRAQSPWAAAVCPHIEAEGGEQDGRDSRVSLPRVQRLPRGRRRQRRSLDR
jgi:MerR family copper efflux transcriptional regulator